MPKTRNDAAKILLEKGWTFEEIEAVLIKKTTKARPRKPVKPKTGK